jgi:trehalose-phosphatase
MSRPLSESQPELRECIAQASRVLLCLDLGGTIAPLVEHPDDVYITRQMRQAVAALTAKGRVTVAIISGRNRAYLQELLQLPNVFYVGNHGLEISGPGVLFIEPTAASCSVALRDLAVALQKKLQSVAGVLVEYKGLTLSVHYRMAAPEEHEHVRQVVHGTLAKANHPFVLKTGPMVYEIRPRVYWNKGSAVGWIQEQLAQPNALVIYLGDDASDEDAFATLPDAITIKVGATPDTAAHYHVDSLAEVQAFLEWLEDQVR